MRQPLLVLNFKNFSTSTGENAVRLARIAETFAKQNKNFQVVVCPSFTDLPAVAKVCNHCWIFSQHVDAVEYGAFTGSVPISVVKKYCRGTVLNHAERKIPFSTLKQTISLCKKHKLQTLVCVDSVKEAVAIAKLRPTFVALEPPDLIGSGVSISSARPEVVSSFISAIRKISPKQRVLVGAGVSTAKDVRRSLELGADGVLVASAFAKNKNPKTWLRSLI